MIEKVGRYICVVIGIILLLIIFSQIENQKVNADPKAADLVIFGDNIKTDYKPFIEGDGIYIAVDTIEKVLDEHIFYDKIATKVIITTKNEVIKMKIDESKMSKNMEYVDLKTPAKIVNDQPYVDINVLKDLYEINVSYNPETATITVDNRKESDIKVQYNNVKVYDKLSTKSAIVQTLNKEDVVTVYTESLKHNRWYKIKTSSGNIGYVAKNTVQLPDNVNEEENETPSEPTAQNNEKITMFWQYGSELKTLGDKVEGVNVVSPTWYELKNSSGEITSKYSKSYDEKAKSNGYQVWPIVTNGIDSVNYLPADTSAMLNSEYNREQFIKNLVALLKENKADGVNIDFESMKTEDKEIYTQFIRELAPILRKDNIKLSVDMYFVAYIDRKGVGAAADYVILMGYDQRGAWSSEAGSIAEASWVEKNIDSLLNDSKIPANKIILGVPFYTRLWTIKEGDAKPTTKVYSMQDCQDYLAENKLTAKWDEAAGQNYAEHKSGSLTYKLWIEDKDSIKRRVETVNKYNLAGISGWRRGLETDDIWKTIADNMKK